MGRAFVLRTGAFGAQGHGSPFCPASWSPRPQDRGRPVYQGATFERCQRSLCKRRRPPLRSGGGGRPGKVGRRGRPEGAAGVETPVGGAPPPCACDGLRHPTPPHQGSARKTRARRTPSLCQNVSGETPAASPPTLLLPGPDTERPPTRGHAPEPGEQGPVRGHLRAGFAPRQPPPGATRRWFSPRAAPQGARGPGAVATCRGPPVGGAGCRAHRLAQRSDRGPRSC
jgi:hypothetical protein